MPYHATKNTYILILLAFMLVPLLHFSPAIADETSEEADSVKSEEIVYPKRMANRETWEWFLSAPGLLVNIPFAVSFKVTEKVVSTLYQPNVVGWFYDITTSDDSTRAIRPAYSSRSGLGFRAYQKELFNDESEVQFSAKAGLNRRQKYQLKFMDFRLFADGMYTDLYAGYRFLHNQEFYGIGPDTKSENQTNHAFEKWWINWHLRYEVFDKFKIGTEIAFDHNNVLNRIGEHDDPATIDIYDEITLAGLENEVRIIGYIGKLEYDSRNSIGGPRSGQRIRLNAGIYNQVGDDLYKFWKIKLDARQYIHLFAGRVIQLRLNGQMNEPIDDKVIPFYYLSELGWTETIRGFPRGRFWDKDMVLGSIEYRWPVWRRLATTIDAFIFYDFGHVANDIMEDLEPDKLQHGFGGGFRIWDDYHESLNLILAGSEEEFRIFLGYNK